jgi:hypothetical protein
LNRIPKIRASVASVCDALHPVSDTTLYDVVSRTVGSNDATPATQAFLDSKHTEAVTLPFLNRHVGVGLRSRSAQYLPSDFALTPGRGELSGSAKTNELHGRSNETRLLG